MIKRIFFNPLITEIKKGQAVGLFTGSLPALAVLHSDKEAVTNDRLA